MLLRLTVFCFVCFVACNSKWEVRDNDKLKLNCFLLCKEEAGTLTVVLPVHFRGFGKIAKGDHELRHVSLRPSVYPHEEFGSHWKDIYETRYLRRFGKGVEKIRVFVKI
jgi:hypothetical protein